MAFTRPTLSTLVSRIETDLVGRLEITATVLRRAMIRIIARVWAGAVHGLYGYIEWAVRQMFASTAEREYLELHGSEFRVPRKGATTAVGSVTFSGLNGSSIPIGTRLQRQDAVEYETTAASSISGGAATVPVVATLAGALPNADAGVSLSVITPVPDVSSAAVVAVGGITGGIETERDEPYRARILARKRKQPQGGAADDYESWALEVAGVTRVWVYGNYMGAGTVGVTFVLDGQTNIIPDAPKVSEVQTYIEAPGRRPLCAQVDVFAPIAVPLNPHIAVTPNTTAVRLAVQAQLEDFIFREGEPGGTLILSQINEAISAATGENDHDLVSPAVDVIHGPSELPTLGTITWV